MLVEDRTAFVEQLAVQQPDRREQKRRRRLVLADIDVMRLEVEVRLADDARRAMANELANNRDRAATTPGLLLKHRARALEREIRTVRRRLRSKCEELQEKRERLHRLLGEVVDDDGIGRGARMYRLHSAQHHLDCSERRFARLATSQLELPVLVTKRDGRRWWWYLDRFWWGDERLSARDIESLVLEADLGTRERAAELAHARAAVLGEELAPVPEESLSPIVRFAVWCRGVGRCVDCRTSESLGYDQIVPFSKGGSRWVANVELRCAPCRERRRRNKIRKRVGRARIEAMPYRRAPTDAPARRGRRRRRRPLELSSNGEVKASATWRTDTVFDPRVWPVSHPYGSRWPTM